MCFTLNYRQDLPLIQTVFGDKEEDQSSSRKNSRDISSQQKEGSLSKSSSQKSLFETGIRLGSIYRLDV